MDTAVAILDHVAQQIETSESRATNLSIDLLNQDDPLAVQVREALDVAGEDRMTSLENVMRKLDPSVRIFLFEFDGSAVSERVRKLRISWKEG